MTLLGYIKINNITVSVENTCYSDVYTILSLESISQSLRDALPLIITSAGTDGVNVTPTIDILHKRWRIN